MTVQRRRSSRVSAIRSSTGPLTGYLRENTLSLSWAIRAAKRATGELSDDALDDPQKDPIKAVPSRTFIVESVEPFSAPESFLRTASDGKTGPEQLSIPNEVRDKMKLPQEIQKLGAPNVFITR